MKRFDLREIERMFREIGLGTDAARQRVREIGVQMDEPVTTVVLAATDLDNVSRPVSEPQHG